MLHNREKYQGVRAAFILKVVSVRDPQKQIHSMSTIWMIHASTSCWKDCRHHITFLVSLASSHQLSTASKSPSSSSSSEKAVIVIVRIKEKSHRHLARTPPLTHTSNNSTPQPPHEVKNPTIYLSIPKQRGKTLTNAGLERPKNTP